MPSCVAQSLFVETTTFALHFLLNVCYVCFYFFVIMVLLSVVVRYLLIFGILLFLLL